jgi:hypothetical protein
LNSTNPFVAAKKTQRTTMVADAQL